MKPIMMKSMEMDDDEKLDAVAGYPMPTKPDFPYGLRICLTEKEFEKLGLDPAYAEVNGMVHGHFMGRITDVHAASNENGDTARVEIQIEDLAIESETEENDEYEQEMQ